MFQLERQASRVLRSQHQLQPDHALSRPQHSNVCTCADVTAGVQTGALCHDAKKHYLSTVRVYMHHKLSANVIGTFSFNSQAVCYQDYWLEVAGN